jgi:hypothetical protein
MAFPASLPLLRFLLPLLGLLTAFPAIMPVALASLAIPALLALFLRFLPALAAPGVEDGPRARGSRLSRATGRGREGTVPSGRRGRVASID